MKKIILAILIAIIPTLVWAGTKVPAKDITVDASGFHGNLTTSDTDVQIVAGKLNALANISGNAATATALATMPTSCNSGNYPGGIDARGNAQNCAALVSTSTTVNGHALTGNISITKSDVGLGNSDNTSDVNKPVSTATQTALDTKVDKTTTVNGHALSSNVTVTKTDVGLGNVQNLDQTNAGNITQDSTHRFVSDTEKSTWNGKQDALGFTAVPNTRQVNGHALSADVTVTKSDVGLGNADNTSDLNKPISTATQAALNGKQASGNYLVSIGTTTPTSLTGLIRGNGSVLSADNSTFRTGTLTSGRIPKAGTSPVMVDSLLYEANSKIGINISPTLATLEIASPNAITDSYGNIFVKTTDALAADVGGSIAFGGAYNTGIGYATYGSFGARKTNATSGNADGYFFIASSKGTTNIERARIDADGNMGIGTTSPQTKLDVNGTVKATAFVGDGASLTNLPITASGWNTDSSTKTTTTYNVGIGSSSPSQKVDVVGTVKATAFVGDGSGLTGISAGSQWSGTAGSAISYNSANVGIGTSSPRTALEVDGTIYGTNVGVGTTSPLSSIQTTQGVSADSYWVGQTISYVAGWKWKKIYSYSYNITSVTNGVLRISFTNDSDFGVYAKSDGSDIRFGNSTSANFPYVKKYYAMTGASAASGTFDVNIGTTGVGGNIYVYYGNASATDASDGVATYGPRYVKAYAMKAQSSADPKNYAVSGSDDLTVSGSLYWSASGQYSKTGSTYTGYISIPTTGMNFATTGAVVFNYVSNGGNYLNRTLLSFSQPSTGANHNHMLIYVGSDYNLYYYYNYNGGYTAYSLGYFNPSANHTIGLVKTGTNTWRAYLDGNSVYAGLPGYVTAPTLMYWGAQTQTESSYGNAGGVESAISGLWVENSSATSNYDPTKLFVQQGSAGSAQFANPLTGFATYTGQPDYIKIYNQGIETGQITGSGINLTRNASHFSGPVGQFNDIYNSNNASDSGKYIFLYARTSDGLLQKNGNNYVEAGTNTFVTSALKPTNLPDKTVPYTNSSYGLQGDLTKISYDYTNKAFGVNAGSIPYPINMQGGDTVGDASSASVSANYYSVPADPTSSSGESVTFNYEAGMPDSVDNGSSGIQYGSGVYTANGQTDYYRIWAVNALGHRSTNPLLLQYTNDNSSTQYYVGLSYVFTVNVVANNYYIEHSTDNTTWEYQNNSSTNFTDYGSGWTPGQLPFDVPYKTQVTHFYQSWALNGIAYSNGNVTWSGTPSLSIADTATFYAPSETLSGSGYEQLGQQLTYYVFARYSPTGGNSYIYSPSGYSNSLYLTNNPGNYTDVYLTWDAVTPPSGSAEYFLILYDGSNYYYQIVSGNSTTDYGLSVSWNTWTGSIPPANDIFWYTNSVTPPSGNSKIFKQDSEHGWAFDHYRDGDISTFTDLFTNVTTPWSAGSKVQTGYQSAGQTIDFQVWSKRLASGIGIFSSGHADQQYVDPNNDGSWFTINLNWGGGAYADSYRVLRSINFGGFTTFYDTANVYLTDDSTNWFGGPTLDPKSNGFGLFVDSLLRPGTNAPVPTNSSQPGTKGTYAFDSNYIYYCDSDNHWVRTALSTF